MWLLNHFSLRPPSGKQLIGTLARTLNPIWLSNEPSLQLFTFRRLSPSVIYKVRIWRIFYVKVFSLFQNGKKKTN